VKAAIAEVTRRRLRNQRLIGKPFATVADAVGWLGAVQSQDYAGAKWGLGRRTARVNDADLDRLFDQGVILRTHLMRPTWHFVLPADIRWLLALTAPRVHAASAYYYRQNEVDGPLFVRSEAILARALRGGGPLTRPEIGALLRGEGIDATGTRLAHILMHAELEAVICSGARRGKQFTYALLDERAPGTTPLARDKALAELARRYFTSHGPATVNDCAWWSGLTAADVRAGIEAARLERVDIDGRTYWFALSSSPAAPAPSPTIHLLPNYDEYLVAYKDRAAAFDPAVASKLDPDGMVLAAHIVVLDGLVVGGWRRSVARTEIAVETDLLVRLGKKQKAALDAAAQRYARFMGLPVRVARRTG
jgi:hypothetical protein